MPAYYGDFAVPQALCSVPDVAAYLTTAAPANCQQLILSATRLVLRETRQAYYTADPASGLATDSYIAAALHDATVVQVAAWATIGYNPLTGGILQTSVAQSQKIGSGSIAYADGKLAAQSRADALNELVPEAHRILEMANLLIPNPWTFG